MNKQLACMGMALFIGCALLGALGQTLSGTRTRPTPEREAPLKRQSSDPELSSALRELSLVLGSLTELRPMHAVQAALPAAKRLPIAQGNVPDDSPELAAAIKQLANAIQGMPGASGQALSKTNRALTVQRWVDKQPAFTSINSIETLRDEDGHDWERTHSLYLQHHMFWS
jgi:hypothetical protein